MSETRAPLDDGRWESRRIVSLAAGVLAAALVYTLHRALVLRIEYYDGYESLFDARVLLGDPLGPYSPVRAPFVVLAQLPAVLLARAREPANLAWLVAPHLTSALLSFAALAAVFRVYHPPLGTTLSTLGTALFAATPFFVRYGAHVMGDLPGAGWAAAVIALYVRGRDRRSTTMYLVCGLALGGAIGTRYELIMLCPALGVAEVGYALWEGRLDGPRWAGLLLCAVTATGTFLALTGGIVLAAYPAGLRAYLQVLANLRRLDLAGTHHESARDYMAMAPVMLSTPTLLLGMVGFGRALAQRRADDIPFLAWLGIVGGSVVFLIRHNEARFLLPTVPALIYFSMRGADLLVRGFRGRLVRPIGVAITAVLVAWALLAGVHQAVLDQEPVFFSDVARRAAQELLRARRPGGRLIWIGASHTLHPRDPSEVPHDEYFDTFHYGPQGCACLVGEPVWQAMNVSPDHPEALAAELVDGDAILKAAPVMYETETVPRAGVQPLEILAVHRVRLGRSRGARFVAREPPSIALSLREAGGQLLVTPERNYGTWSLLVEAGLPDTVHSLGARQLRAGEEILLGTGSASAVAGFVLVRLDLERIVF